MGDQNDWPKWWRWRLEFSKHVIRRMHRRHLTQPELRQLLEDATSWEPGYAEGRYEILTRFEEKFWVVVVEPDEVERKLVVITAFAVV